MNRSELIDQLASRTDSSKAAAERLLSAFIDVVGETLAAGDKISLVGFGTFVATDIPARTGRNPRTGRELKIAATKRPKFSAGETLKKKVNA